MHAQQENADVRAGNRLYEEGNYIEAEIAFRHALNINPQSFEANFNLGNALFRQEKYEEAFRQYNRALALLPENDNERRAAVLHNIGNTLLISGNIAQSIEAYKQSLKNNPMDDETRYNLAFAQKLLQDQEQNQGEQNQEQQQQREQQEQDQNQQQQNQPEQQQEPIMSQENAQQILNALLEDERQTQERARQQRPRSTRNVEKDW